MLTSALTSQHMWDLAQITGTELIVIDADTKLRDVTNELRWNQAYYILAQGF